jgi:hypothetical protein
MISSMKRLTQKIVVAVAGVMLTAGSAWAALPEKPNPISQPDKPLWYAYVIAFVLIAGAAAATFKNAKRTHLD